MVGDFEDQEYKGIIPRSFDYLFERIKQIQGKEWKHNMCRPTCPKQLHPQHGDTHTRHQRHTLL